MMNIENVENAQKLAQAIVNTLPDPFLVLDDQFRVLAGSRSFYETFNVDPAQTHGCLLFALGSGQWDIPGLRVLLETIIPEHASMDGFEVEHDFPQLGHRVMLLNARTVAYDDDSQSTILLAFKDITDRRTMEREKERLLERSEDLLRQNHVLLQEMEHRVANSLQIIASILSMKARAVTSEETRLHLRDAHQRVMAVASVQKHLHASDGVDQIEVGSYLSGLCSSVASSMIGEDQPIAIKVIADGGKAESGRAVSIGLVVTELLINAVKYAFPVVRSDARIVVSYGSRGSDWRLTVSDNGVGKPVAERALGKDGLGTAIVRSLAKQLGATVETSSGPGGLAVSISRGFISLPAAA
jgi:two-component sensor histidine kinase